MHRHKHTRKAQRRGSVFAYAMAYMTLSLLLLGLMGTTLHTLMRVSQSDQQVFQDLSDIRRLETSLRDDLAAAQELVITSDALKFSSGDHITTWTVQDHTVIREVTKSHERAAVAKIRFRRGTSLAFRREDNLLLVLRIVPPSRSSTRDQSPQTSGNTLSNAIEILLAQPTPISPVGDPASSEG